jgi:DNA-binding transcriptional regulator YdaS (Cro superfamily)
MRHDIDRGLVAAIEAAGNRTELASRLGITLGAISQWDKVPINRVLEVEKATGVPRYVLRPDFFLSRETA